MAYAYKIEIFNVICRLAAPEQKTSELLNGAKERPFFLCLEESPARPSFIPFQYQYQPAALKLYELEPFDPYRRGVGNLLPGEPALQRARIAAEHPFTKDDDWQPARVN